MRLTKTIDIQEESLRKYVTVKIFGKDIKFQLDSGSDRTILNFKAWKKLQKPSMLRSYKTVKVVNGTQINFEGEVITNVTLLGKTKKLKMNVLKNTENLFDSDCMHEFNLWDLPISTFYRKAESCSSATENLISKLKKEFAEVFTSGLGKCTKIAAELKLKKNMQPVFRRKRNVPFSSLDKINQELDRLENVGILSKTEYNQWDALVVYVKKKSGEIRVYADFSTGLNASLEDLHYPLPSPEEVFTKLNGGSFFSKIDLSDAYLQIPVNYDSANLLCINTHRSLYRYERLAFGVKVAPAIFQRVMDTVLGGLDFAIAYLDIIIASRNMEQHTDHIYQVFKRLQDYGFKVK